jgi:hypothetical protein
MSPSPVAVPLATLPPRRRGLLLLTLPTPGITVAGPVTSR